MSVATRLGLYLAATCSAMMLAAFGARVEAADAPARPAWTTSRIQGSPEPPLPYITEVVFPKLKFDHPIDLGTPAGSERLYVLQQDGKLYSFTPNSDVPQADLVFDFPHANPDVRETYAITFHPDFEQNRYCYVCAIGKTEQPDGTRVSRFRVLPTEPPTIDPASEQVMIRWLSGGHNGCCLAFGRDGYLYISTGDAVGPNPPDTLRTGQDVSDLLSSILRIDVDHNEGERPYRIPEDNPLRQIAGARPEIWAYGFRNPWRMSFDRRGDLWVGDVGWELWEMMIRVERGGNYGWSIMEGPQPTNPDWPRGPTPILPPTLTHPHSESSSVTGGPTYYGSRLPDLQGALIYGDYDTGKIWGARWEDGRVTWQQELADTTLRIVGFGTDRAEELYIVDHIGGTLHRLVANPLRNQPSTFPRQLSDTGLFTSLSKQTPAPGVLPYQVAAEPWADHASTQRWVAVPGTQPIDTKPTAWQFPKDTVLVKTLSLEMERGKPETCRHVETQLLHYTGVDWRAYSYEWNTDQTDAVLVDASGTDRSFDITDREAAGGRRKQTWHYASRTECLRCHNPWSGSALGFQLPQLHRGGQLDELHAIGLLSTAIPADKRPTLADPRETSADLTTRARAYLHANCAHCHRQHAGGAVISVLQYDLPLEKMNLLEMVPMQGTFGISEVRVIAPKDPDRSVLLYRMAKLGGGRMPHLGSQWVDREGVALIAQWIEQLPAIETAGTSTAVLKRRTAEQAQLSKLTTQHANPPEVLVDQLLGSTSAALGVMRAIDAGQLPKPGADFVVSHAAQHAQPQIRDLFERFLPDEQRVRRLGSVVRPEQILALSGDSERGQQVFFATEGVQCKNCHRIREMGKEIGPDLSQIGKRLNAAQLLESLLEPSKTIDPKYVTYELELEDGRVLVGLLSEKTDQQIVLRDAQDQLLRIPLAEVERIGRRQQSLMPELLLRDLTAEQVADLLAYLGSLR